MGFESYACQNSIIDAEAQKDHSSGLAESVLCTAPISGILFDPDRSGSVLSRSASLDSTQAAGYAARMENLLSVYAGTAADLPQKLSGKLVEDFTSRTGSTALKLAGSAAFGLGSALLLARSPVLTRTLLAGSGVVAGGYMGYETLKFTASAANAFSAQERAALRGRAGDSLADLSADLLETAPAFMAAAGLATRLNSQPAALERASSWLQNNVELQLRSKLPESFHYYSRDAFKLNTLANSEANLLEAGQLMMKRSPWRGVEEGRFFKIGDDALKVSAGLPGKELELYMGRRAQNMFHTHKERILPTSSDFNSVFGTGVIAVPERGVLTFYEGSAKYAEQLIAAQKAGQMEKAAAISKTLHERNFRTLILEPAQQRAVRVDLNWNGAAGELQARSLQAVSYDSAIKSLSTWRGKLNIDSLRPDPDAMLKPGMTDFLREIVR